MNRRNLLKAGSAYCALSTFGGAVLADNEARLHVPPEESPHELTFMQWPVNRAIHPDGLFLTQLQQTIARIANAISEFEPVVMLVAQADQRTTRKWLSKKVALWDIPTEDLWCRDSGPLFATMSTGERVISHLAFNGWGNKQLHRRDSQIVSKVAERLGVQIVSSGLTGEAGGVEHDGHGFLIAHESSWVNENRNPGLTRDQIEQRLLAAYGAKQMIWSPGVRDEDITDYHIDSLARFAGAGKILINLPEEPDLSDSFHVAALQTHDALKRAKFEIQVIHEPTKRRVESLEFVASYANYYACNGGIIAAQFGDRESDEVARAALHSHYPNREIVTLNVDALGEVGGGIHCATQQLPAKMPA